LRRRDKEMDVSGHNRRQRKAITSRNSILALASIGVPAAVVRQAQATALLGKASQIAAAD
jgi:phage tail sheath gpL-like